MACLGFGFLPSYARLGYPAIVGLVLLVPVVVRCSSYRRWRVPPWRRRARRHGGCGDEDAHHRSGRRVGTDRPGHEHGRQRPRTPLHAHHRPGHDPLVDGGPGAGHAAPARERPLPAPATRTGVPGTPAPGYAHPAARLHGVAGHLVEHGHPAAGRAVAGHCPAYAPGLGAGEAEGGRDQAGVEVALTGKGSILPPSPPPSPPSPPRHAARAADRDSASVSASASVSRPTRVARARATRERTVPTGQPLTSAASA